MKQALIDFIPKNGGGQGVRLRSSDESIPYSHECIVNAAAISSRVFGHLSQKTSHVFAGIVSQSCLALAHVRRDSVDFV